MIDSQNDITNVRGYLIDFGYSDKYVGASNQHIGQDEETDKF